MRGNPIPACASSEVLEVVVIYINGRVDIIGHRNGLTGARAQGLLSVRTRPRPRGRMTAGNSYMRCEHRGWSRSGYRGRAPNQLAELSDHLLERRCLGIEFLGRAGAFFGTGRIALSDLIHLGNGGVDLFDALGLFARGRGNFSDQRVGGRHLASDLSEGFADLGATDGAV